MSGQIPDTEYRENSEWAVHYRQRAAHFKQLASIELQPRARAQFIGLAEEYDRLADDGPRKLSADFLRRGAGNNLGRIAVSWGDMGRSEPPS
jgi:hypothetical protein